MPPFQYFHHVPHILHHCAQHHGRSFWRTWPRHQTLISEKWPKIVKKGPKNYNMIFIQKTPHILHNCAQHRDRSFWRTWPTHQTLILSVRLFFWIIFFIYQIGCSFNYFTILNHQFFTSFIVKTVIFSFFPNDF